MLLFVRGLTLLPALSPLTPLPAAFAIKQRIYGNRIVLFAPLYIANYCVNNCRYCAFRQGNKSLEVRGGGGAGKWQGWMQGRQRWVVVALQNHGLCRVLTVWNYVALACAPFVPASPQPLQPPHVTLTLHAALGAQRGAAA